VLNHQKLNCYQKSLGVIRALLKEMSTWPSGHANLKDQAKRAAISASLNLAEGCGKVSPKDKRKFYAIARGSILEVSACIDIAHVLTFLPEEKYNAFQSELLQITRMISKLIKSTS